jgi:hypothetical protein
MAFRADTSDMKDLLQALVSMLAAAISILGVAVGADRPRT